jgi:hypothetical protein
VFVGSYFCARAETLKRVQMLGALMWTAYGFFIGASPVVVANLLVFGAAAWTTWRVSPRAAIAPSREMPSASRSVREPG